MANSLAYSDTSSWSWPSGRIWNRGSTRARSSTITATASGVQEVARSEAATTGEAAAPAILKPDWLDPVLQRINHLLTLQDGWDGPGSLGINADVALRALQLLSQVAGENTRSPSISPGRDGGLQFAWYARELDLEIDIPRTGKPTISLYDRDLDTDSELKLTSPGLFAAIAKVSAA